MSAFLRTCTNLFPVWVVACGVLALFQPTWFTWFDKPKIIWGLGVIMLGMGVTLRVEDFVKVARMPLPILTGFLAQYLIMPFLGFAVAKLSGLPKEFAVGVILVSCCPGGTASNVVTYLARANLPLSLLMTMCSTFTAALMTPMLVEFYAGAIVPVPFWGLVKTTATVVLLPIVAGILIHHLFPKAVEAVSDIAPLISVITIALICGTIIGGNIDALKQHGLSLLFAVVVLHSLAFLLGYFFARLFRYEELVRRTVAIEVGMQNSGLGTVLAQKHFQNASGVSLAAVPCAISATTHCVIGSILAALWRTRLPKEPEIEPAPEPSASTAD